MRISSHKLITVVWLGFVACVACSPAQQSYEQRMFAFGTIVTVKLSGVNDSDSRAAVAALGARFRRIDVDWYPWPKTAAGKPGKLSNINANIAAGRMTEVDPELADLIRRASEIERLSGGRFNPAIGRFVKEWGFDGSVENPGSVPDQRRIDELLRSGPSTAQLFWDGNRLGSRSGSVFLDLGGIAKGAILQLSVELLRSRGIDNAIVDIGGDLTVMGDVHGRSARIGIRSPVADGSAIGWLEVTNGETVVTSGNYERFFELDGKRYAHIIDPRTGRPVMHTSSVTVVHQDAVLADAAATALAVGGMAEFDEICAALGITEAMIVNTAGDLRLTSTMEKRVHLIQ